MNNVDLIFGDKLADCVQYIIGEGFRQHTPESMIRAAHNLEGIRTLLEWNGRYSSTFNIQISNEISRCYRAAELIKEGKL